LIAAVSNRNSPPSGRYMASVSTVCCT
jgi:hypothetical protein